MPCAGAALGSGAVGGGSATVGAVYGNRQLLENNSTLRERIAQAAQLINENT